LLEKLVESQVDLIHGLNQTNKTLEEIKTAIEDIANLDDRVRKPEMPHSKRQVNGSCRLLLNKLILH